MLKPTGSYQPATKPAERRAFFDERRRLLALQDQVDEITADITPTAWTAPTLATGWTEQASYPVRYSRTNGIVQLRGRVQTNLTGTNLITTLPAGFRPPQAALYATVKGPTAGIVGVEVLANGQVNHYTAPGASGDWCSLDVITFAVA